jgi:hypothetical protein
MTEPKTLKRNTEKSSKGLPKDFIRASGAVNEMGADMYVPKYVPKTELESLKQAAKRMGKKPPKDLVKAAKAIDNMRAVFKEAGFDPLEEYLKDKYGNR